MTCTKYFERKIWFEDLRYHTVTSPFLKDFTASRSSREPPRLVNLALQHCLGVMYSGENDVYGVTILPGRESNLRPLEC